ncbi:alpha/beta fold hydrolase [Cellulosilyticum sp. WCF-2]|nr:alpha/beta hydrolase [Cellulosilyticum sp. WCF-2]QEH70448.1 alpha/beta hydrolase [Cellulosilyticum sp. WCF-2]
MVKVYRSKKAEQAILRTYDELLKQWGISYEEQMISTRYGNTHVISWGKKDGLPIVLFHGVGDDSALMWYYNAKELGKHFQLFAVDTIGGPGKTKPGEAYGKGFDDALWIDDTLNGLGLAKASLIGVSHGGYLVQLYTVKRPERVQIPIVMAASVAAVKSGSSMKTMFKVFFPEALVPTRKNVQKLLSKMTGEHTEVFIENPLLLEHFCWLMRGFNNMAMKYHSISSLSEKEIELLRTKAFFLVGLEDPFEKLGGEAILREKKMRVKFFEGVGHGINHEIAEQINQEIIHIIEKNSFT